MLRRFSAIFLFLLAGISGAASLSAEPDGSDISNIQVRGWSAEATPSNTSVYNLDGRKIGQRDFSAVNVGGAHRWDANFDLVEIVPGEWVQKRLLATIMCDQAFAESKRRMPTPGKPEHSRAVAMGSGTACPD